MMRDVPKFDDPSVRTKWAWMRTALAAVAVTALVCRGLLVNEAPGWLLVTTCALAGALVIVAVMRAGALSMDEVRPLRTAKALAVTVALIVISLVAVIGGSPPAKADASTSVNTWADTAAVSPAGASWWAPTGAAGMTQAGDVEVQWSNLTYQSGMYLPQVTGGQSLAMANYSAGNRKLTIMESIAGTTSPIAVDPIPNAAPVGQVLIKSVWVGWKGAQSDVTATVTANCVRTPPKAGATCKPRDVKRWGGSISFVAQPDRPGDPFGTTNVTIMTSPGTSYAQLVRIAKGLTQIPGTVQPPQGTLQ